MVIFVILYYSIGYLVFKDFIEETFLWVSTYKEFFDEDFIMIFFMALLPIVLMLLSFI